MTTVFIMIGLSGAGKTTWVRDQITQYEDASVWSLNNLRLQYAYKELGIGRDLALWEEPTAQEYEAAWEATKDDDNFHHVTNSALSQMIGRAIRGAPLFIDNMNLRRKGRRQLVNRMRNKGFHVVGVYIKASYAESMARQQRGLPEDVIRQHVDNMDIPLSEEFDTLLTVGPLWR
jgi:predicted kinase